MARDPDVGGIASAIELRAMIARFASKVVEWRLDDSMVDRLLCAPPGYWRDAKTEWPPRIPLRACERRMRQVLDIADAQGRLGCVEDPAAWLQKPNPGLDGQSPLAAVGLHPAALAYVREKLSADVRLQPDVAS